MRYMYVQVLIYQAGDHDIRKIGIENEEWHINVVRAAVRKRGKYLEKQTVTDTGCKALMSSPNDTYIVDGILNRAYYLKYAKGPAGEWRYQKGHDVQNRTNDWRHCIGIKDNRIRCTGVHHHGISTGNLHLDMEG